MSQTVEISLDDGGQITIPSDVKDKLGWSPGMTLLVEEGDEDTLRLRVQ
jgi:AbrB family looped-hinge helix DNA binding protein